jgi:hypothetical protein
MSPKQKKLAAKAPPPNKINEKDFAVLRAEKAKGRGMGLQDEKVKPGKVMKARVGKSIKVKDDSSFSKKMELQEKGVINKKTGAGRERITKAVKATSLGRKLLLPVAAGVAVSQYLKSKMKKKKDEPKKKMGGGMMQKPMGYKEGRSIITRGGGVDSSIIGRLRDAGPFKRIPLGKSRLTDEDRKNLRNAMQKRNSRKAALDTAKRVTRTVASVASPVTAAASAAYKLAKKMKDKDRLTDRDIDKAKSMNNTMGSKNRPIKKDHSSRNPNPKTPKMMGGGMMQKPMGYRSGTMVKARGCKLGRTRPTKIT